MEFYYKPQDRAYDRNSIESILGANPEVMDEETLVQHQLYQVEEAEADPFLLSQGAYSYNVQGGKAIRSIVETPVELSEAKRIAKLKILELIDLDFPRFCANNQLSTECLLALSLIDDPEVRKVFSDRINPVKSFFEQMVQAIQTIDNSETFDSVKQTVISAYKRD